MNAKVLEVGVFLTGMERVRKSEPDRDEYSQAFYQDECGVHPCWLDKKELGGRNDFSIYHIQTERGLNIKVPSYQVLTGWESDFPDWLAIDWGYFSIRDRSDGEDGYIFQIETYLNSGVIWEPDDDYYSDLADEWEEWDTANANSIAEAHSKNATG